MNLRMAERASGGGSGRSRRHGLAVAALASAAFVYVTAEGLPVGLLGQMSGGLHSSVSAIGLLVTVYAGVAGLAAVPVTAWMDRRDRRHVVVGAVSLLAVSQLVMAVAPNYAGVLAARVVCALAHGVFWSMLAPVAARLAPPGRAGRATAMVFVGNSLALVAGIPIASAIGQAAGWRVAMAAMGAVAAVSAGALWVTMPSLPAVGARQGLRAVKGLLQDRGLAALCAITALAVIGHFGAYTYITSLIRRDAGLAGFAVSAVLFVYGAAGVAGIGVVGPRVDRSPRQAAALCVGGLVVAMGALALVARGSVVVTVVAVGVWGAAFTAFPVALQTAVLRVAPHAADAASALYVVAFQIGIGGGALVGAALVAGGHLAVLPGLGALLALAAGAVVALRWPAPAG
ncbi:MFS transporter [Acidiferrimicrobium sp. IK]|uniref:MFS transporter n=1 Tax=Acidiferrimicrobium sp. IK TaxID=2871700 RepID=UPI0021CB1CF8|nr:MFS transporter [Acidiferrimicrobium sp. IK]MCU4186576.1 MFS transporter [Acidiferrimicrobium sp. IK]